MYAAHSHAEMQEFFHVQPRCEATEARIGHFDLSPTSEVQTSGEMLDNAELADAWTDFTPYHAEVGDAQGGAQCQPGKFAPWVASSLTPQMACSSWTTSLKREICPSAHIIPPPTSGLLVKQSGGYTSGAIPPH